MWDILIMLSIDGGYTVNTYVLYQRMLLCMEHTTAISIADSAKPPLITGHLLNVVTVA